MDQITLAGVTITAAEAAAALTACGLKMVEVNIDYGTVEKQLAEEGLTMEQSVDSSEQTFLFHFVNRGEIIHGWFGNHMRPKLYACLHAIIMLAGNDLPPLRPIIQKALAMVPGTGAKIVTYPEFERATDRPAGSLESLREGLAEEKQIGAFMKVGYIPTTSSAPKFETRVNTLGEERLGFAPRPSYGAFMNTSENAIALVLILEHLSAIAAGPKALAA